MPYYITVSQPWKCMSALRWGASASQTKLPLQSCPRGTTAGLLAGQSGPTVAKPVPNPSHSMRVTRSTGIPRDWNLTTAWTVCPASCRITAGKCWNSTGRPQVLPGITVSLERKIPLIPRQIMPIWHQYRGGERDIIIMAVLISEPRMTIVVEILLIMVLWNPYVTKYLKLHHFLRVLWYTHLFAINLLQLLCY